MLWFRDCREKAFRQSHCGEWSWQVMNLMDSGELGLYYLLLWRRPAQTVVQKTDWKHGSKLWRAKRSTRMRRRSTPHTLKSAPWGRVLSCQLNAQDERVGQFVTKHFAVLCFTPSTRGWKRSKKAPSGLRLSSTAAAVWRISSFKAHPHFIMQRTKVHDVAPFVATFSSIWGFPQILQGLTFEPRATELLRVVNIT